MALTKEELRFAARVRKGPGCWQWDGARTPTGYGYMHVRRKGRKTKEGAHRISYRLHIGDIPKGKYVLHECDNPSCVRPDHLRVGTQAENLRDMVKRGRSLRGQRNHQAKLQAKQVLAIRELVARGYSQRRVADRFGVARGTVQAIANRSSWAWL